MIRVLCSALILSALCAGAVHAASGVPDPSLSTVPGVLVAPGGTTYCVTIVGASGPVAAAAVELRYSAGADTAACWCSSQTRPVPAAVTNGSGVACFTISGGACIDPSVTGFGIDVYVNDIFLKRIGQKSPDVVKTAVCTVSLADAVAFTTPLSTANYSYCYDLVEDNVVGLSDAVAFTPFAATAATCP